MRVDKLGRSITVEDDVHTILNDTIPCTTEHLKGEVNNGMEAFLDSPECDEMVRKIIDAVEHHFTGVWPVNENQSGA